MKTFEETCLLTIRDGDLITEIESGRTGQLINVELVPNGVNDPKIVAVLTIKFYNGDRLIATSDKFAPASGELYLEKIYK